MSSSLVGGAGLRLRAEGCCKAPMLGTHLYCLLEVHKGAIPPRPASVAFEPFELGVVRGDGGNNKLLCRQWTREWWRLNGGWPNFIRCVNPRQRTKSRHLLPGSRRELSRARFGIDGTHAPYIGHGRPCLTCRWIHSPMALGWPCRPRCIISWTGRKRPKPKPAPLSEVGLAGLWG